MNSGHWSLYMFEKKVTLHCDFVEGFHMKGDKEETFRRLIRVLWGEQHNDNKQLHLPQCCVCVGGHGFC